MSISKTCIVLGTVATATVLQTENISYAQTTKTQTPSITIIGRVNFRKGPSMDYPVMRKLYKDYKAEYIGKSGNWIKIRYEGTVGYVYRDYTTSIKEVKSNVNFRKRASITSSKLDLIRKGEEVEVIESSGKWIKIVYNGETGYVYGKYLESIRNTTVNVELRKGPGTNYSRLLTIPKGSAVEYIETRGNWIKIKYNQKVGYVYGKYVSNISNINHSQESVHKEDKYVNSRIGLNVRSGYGTSYPIKGILSYGTKVEIVSVKNGWSKIKYNNEYGYVSNSHLQNTRPQGFGGSSNSANSGTNSVSKDVNAVISYAKSLLGKPYIWGAQGPHSFDCSGLMVYVFKNKAGLELPRTSYYQSKFGQYISKKNLRPGDLVFFDTQGVNNGHVSHVGLYIGNRQVLHASYSSRKIVISNFDSSYFQKTYVNARRVL